MARDKGAKVGATTGSESQQLVVLHSCMEKVILFISYSPEQRSKTLLVDPSESAKADQVPKGPRETTLASATATLPTHTMAGTLGEASRQVPVIPQDLHEQSI